jgi:hypothetical protein
MPISELICGKQSDSTFVVNFEVVWFVRENVVNQQRRCLGNQ